MPGKTLTQKRKIHKDGLRAEFLAMLYFLMRGYYPVARRFKTPVGEIDLICRKRGNLVFVECKARPTTAQALEALRARQQFRLRKAAGYFLAARPSCAALTMRFDLLAIGWKDGFRHLRNI